MVRLLPPRTSVPVFTKTRKFAASGAVGNAAAGEMRSSLERSLDQPGQQHVHGLIFHDPCDLLGPDGDGHLRETGWRRRLSSFVATSQLGIVTCKR
ncbi:MAG: hypothetical protein WKF52_00370 [Sphingomicrobium sp.]